MPVKDYYDQEFLKTARVEGKYDEVMKSLKKCPFCDLKSKYLLVEENDFVLSVSLFPYIEGHLLIIPREHKEKLSDIGSEEWLQVYSLAKKGMDLLRKYAGVKNINFLYREGKKSGASLGHIHFHIIPSDIPLLVPKYQRINTSPLEMAELLRKGCENENK